MPVDQMDIDRADVQVGGEFFERENGNCWTIVWKTDDRVVLEPSDPPAWELTIEDFLNQFYY